MFSESQFVGDKQNINLRGSILISIVVLVLITLRSE